MIAEKYFTKLLVSIFCCVMCCDVIGAESVRSVGWQVDLCGESLGAAVGFYHESAAGTAISDYSALWIPRGEGPEVVSRWLNRSIEDSERSFLPASRPPPEPSTCTTLLIPYGNWFLVGCDSGFNIPCPPGSVTLRGDWKASDSSVSWENKGEDHIVLFTVTGRNRLKKGSTNIPDEGISVGLGRYFEGRTARALHDSAFDSVAKAREYYDIPDRGNVLILLQNNSREMLSTFSGIRVEGNRQHEAFNLPFSTGLAPNWLSWCQGSEGGISPTEGHRGDVAVALTQLPQPSTPDEKVFFQQIQVGEPGAVGGTKRRFIGLRSNRAYRLSARLNTMELKNNADDWQYSLHATYATREGLTPDQLAGEAALPNGESGTDAAQMVAYTPENTTNGDWVRTDTGPNEGLQDIVLPEGYDTIVLWVRFTAQDPEHMVGIDWVQLEDLGPVDTQEESDQ